MKILFALSIFDKIRFFMFFYKRPVTLRQLQFQIVSTYNSTLFQQTITFDKIVEHIGVMVAAINIDEVKFIIFEGR